MAKVKEASGPLTEAKDQLVAALLETQDSALREQLVELFELAGEFEGLELDNNERKEDKTTTNSS